LTKPIYSNRLINQTGALSPNDVPSGVIFDTSRSSSKTNSKDEISVFVSSFRDVIVEASKESNLAADPHHHETKEDNDRRHKEDQEAQDKRVVLKGTLADNRVALKAQLDDKGYLKRRIDMLQDEARHIQFKIFESNEMKKKSEEAFFSSELKIVENEIEKCKKDLEK
jgi:hypothetical protein